MIIHLTNFIVVFPRNWTHRWQFKKVLSQEKNVIFKGLLYIKLFHTCQNRLSIVSVQISVFHLFISEENWFTHLLQVKLIVFIKGKIFCEKSKAQIIFLTVNWSAALCDTNWIRKIFENTNVLKDFILFGLCLFIGVICKYVPFD